MILCCVEKKNLFSHWEKALESEKTLHVKDMYDLKSHLSQDTSRIALVHAGFFGETPLSLGLVQLREEAPRLKIMVLSDTPSFEEGKPLLRLGIFGYANARLAHIHLQQAIMLIKEENVWLYPAFVSQMIQGLGAADFSDILAQKLTKREYEIALYVSQGHSNKEIAQKAYISENTVKVHLRTIFEKLGIKDRYSLALMFR